MTTCTNCGAYLFESECWTTFCTPCYTERADILDARKRNPSLAFSGTDEEFDSTIQERNELRQLTKDHVEVEKLDRYWGSLIVRGVQLRYLAIQELSK